MEFHSLNLDGVNSALGVYSFMHEGLSACSKSVMAHPECLKDLSIVSPRYMRIRKGIAFLMFLVP